MDFTYPYVGITREDRPDTPPGYQRIDYAVDLDVPFHLAAETLLSWEMHRRAGLRPETTAGRAAPGVEVVQHFGPIKAGCRVVWSVEMPGRVGFAYGTLPGHPERGEECFLLDETEGGCRFRIFAISRPGRWYTVIGAPIARLAQVWMLRRYARAMDVTRG
ncbi:MAG TPA: DUF1990 domain-containing protein [Phytomonospora sp.]